MDSRPVKGFFSSLLGSDRVVVVKQHFGNRREAHPIVQQYQRVGAAEVAGQVDQVAAGYAVQEAGADHACSRIASGQVSNGFSGFPQSQGIPCRLPAGTSVIIESGCFAVVLTWNAPASA